MSLTRLNRPLLADSIGLAEEIMNETFEIIDLLLGPVYVRAVTQDTDKMRYGDAWLMNVDRAPSLPKEWWGVPLGTIILSYSKGYHFVDAVEGLQIVVYDGTNYLKWLVWNGTSWESRAQLTVGGGWQPSPWPPYRDLPPLSRPANSLKARFQWLKEGADVNLMWIEQNFYRLQALQKRYIVNTVNSPPGSPTDGDMYLISGTPSGAFASYANQLAIRYAPGDAFGLQWIIFPPWNGLICYHLASTAFKIYQHSTWTTMTIV